MFDLLHFRCGSPLFELGEFIDQEYAFALSSVCGFHDPCDIRCPFEFFLKQIVVTWQLVSERHNIEVYELSEFIFLCEWVVFLLHFFPKPLDVLNHKVFSSKLKVIWEMVDQSTQSLEVLTDFH